MEDKLRFLHIEDNPLDAEIIEAELRKEWPDCVYELISSERELAAAMAGGSYSMVISDYALPGFDGLTALSMIQSCSPDIPFLFVTGTMGEELAIESLKSGASDYILKDRIAKLVPSIHRALRDAIAKSDRKRLVEEMKRNLERLKLQQEVSQHHASTVQELLYFSLEKVITLTDSRIGYIYHYSEDTQQFELNTWSKEVLPACAVAEPQSLYQLEKTGIWGEVVRQRTAIVVNDFAAENPLKKGYPAGHVHLSRFLSIPIFDDDRIVAVVGVANKTLPYDQTDVLQLSLMMEGVWKIATRMKMEEQISRAGHEWQSTFDSINDSISLIDTEQLVIRCNRATSLFLGRDFADILGQPCWKLFHGANAPLCNCPMKRARLSLHSETSTIKHQDRWLEVTVDPIVSAQGEMTGAVHLVRDVTERVNLTKSIQEVNDLFKLFMQYSPIYTFIKEVDDSESRVLQASDNFWDMIGIKSQDMIGKTMHELFPKEFADKITADDQQVVASKQVRRLEEYLNDGTYITYKFPIERPDGKRLLAGYTIDITEQKRTEEALRKSQNLLNLTAKQARMGGWELNLSTNDLAWTEEIYRIYELGDGFKPTVENTLAFYAPESLPIISEAVHRAIHDNEPFDLELFLITAKNNKKLVHATGQILLQNGKPCKVSGTFQDITEMRLNEEAMRDMQTQIMQNDKLATIGQLAAGVAHEINNPMGFVGSNMVTLSKYVEKYNRYIQQLEEQLRRESAGLLPEHIQALRQSLKMDYVMRDIAVLVEESNEGIERVKRIVQDLRTFSRADTTGAGLANLNSCMDSTINIVINEIKYSAELKRDYGDIPKVHCNAQQINQIFMNLLINATHAIQAKGEEFGEIVVRTWCDQDNVFVSVSDNGCGIPPENQQKIFDAFFTTKEIGKGTGLGLSISSGIIRKHGGEITLTSEMGVGSTFIVRLPLKQTEQAGEERQ